MDTSPVRWIVRIVTAYTTLAAGVAGAALVGSFDAAGNRDANDVFVAGGFAYVVVDSDGGTDPELFIVDVTPPRSPRAAGSLDIGSNVLSVWSDGSRAYLTTADNAGELVVVDVTSKTAPAVLGTYDLPGNGDGSAVAAVGTTVYVGTKNNSGSAAEFFVINASNPVTPVLLGSFDVGQTVNDLALDGGRAFLATGSGSREFLVLDVTAPSSIAVASSVDVTGSTAGRGVFVEPGRLYGVTDNNSANPDFFVWNVGSGGLLSAVGSVNLDSNNKGVAVAAGRALVATSTNNQGLTVVDLTNPSVPVEATALSTAADANAVTAVDGLAYMATAHNQRELQVVAGSPRANHPPLAAQRDAGVIPVAITGVGFGDGTGGSLIFTQGVNTLTIASSTACTDSVASSSCIAFWDPDWITAKLPSAWSGATVQVVTGANAADRSEPERIQYYALSFVQSQVTGDLNPLPLALAVDENDPLHRLWVNDEHHRYFKSYAPGAGSGVVLPLNHPDPPPFYAGYLHVDVQSTTSAAGEDTIIDPYGRIWFTEGGWTPPDPSFWNYSRIVMYGWDPGTPSTIAETRVYNIPGNDPLVMALAYEQDYESGKDRVWYSVMARKVSIFTIIPARIGWFDPDVAGLAHDGTREFSPDGTCVQYSCTDQFLATCCSDNTTRRCVDDFDCNLSADVCYFGEDRPDCIFHEYKLPAVTFLPSHIQIGPDAAIWYADYWGDSNLGRLDPATGQTTLYPLGDDPSLGEPWLLGSAPWELVVSDGDVVVNEYSDLTINRFDVSRASDTACLTLDGQQNPCTVARQLPGPGTGYSQHTIIPDTKDNIWFGMSGPIDFTSRSAIGYVKRDWKDIVMFPTLSMFPLETGQTSVCAYDAGSGVAVDRSNDQVWFGEYCRRRIGWLRPQNTNLALEKTATQSSMLCFLGICGPASAAVDGDIDGSYADGSVAHTFDVNKPWWQVDLGAVHPLQDVEIWNRTDCCGSRLQNFDVFVSDTAFTSNDPAVIAATPGVLTIHQVAPPGRRFAAAINRTGRYVRVQLLGTTEPLQLAEVVVIGGP
jgi:streptogramin lyase